MAEEEKENGQKKEEEEKKPLSLFDKKGSLAFMSD